MTTTFDDSPDCSNSLRSCHNNQGVPLYTVTEPAVAGYATTYSNCTNLNVASGETEVCTITNNDQGATLKVTKIVVNDNGGTAVVADFPLFIDGGGVTSGVANPVAPGNHTVSERPRLLHRNDSGAVAMQTAGGHCPRPSQACRITNDDNSRPDTLQVRHDDNGGSKTASAWTLTRRPNGFRGALAERPHASFMPARTTCPSQDRPYRLACLRRGYAE